MEKRVTFYIDGFNFYYALRRAKRRNPLWQRYYWLDMVRFCESFLADGQRLERVVYFTATQQNEDKAFRQNQFLRANHILGGQRFEVVRGKYLDKVIVCPACKYAITRPEEKMTDVNISVRMMADCVSDATDIVTLVSADSDLVPPLEFIFERYPQKGVRVYFPPGNFSHDLRDNLRRHRVKPLLLEKNEHRFIQSVMPDTVTDGSCSIAIPDKWRR